jgi:hypothetical protein
MTILKRSSQRGNVPLFRSSAITLALFTAVLLAGCGMLNASTTVVSQGLGDTTLELPGKAENALLANLHGTVEVNTGDGEWTAAKSGQSIQSGQQVRTGALSNVTLVFYDGSQTYLGADAEIAIDMLDARTSGPRLVQMTQLNGESRHIVVKSDDSGSRYDVHTPIGDGSASDSIFTVRVLPGEFIQFWVESGAVSVDSKDVSVEIIAGQTTIILDGQPPQEAMFRTTGEGRVMQANAMDIGTHRRISARIVQQGNKDKITLCHATGSASNPYVKITVSEQGATNGHSKHAGDIIPAPPGGCPTSQGNTTSTSRNWNIAGQEFRAGKHTIIIGNPEPGDWVTFESHLQSDGTRIVDRIVLSNHNPDNQFSFIGRVDAVGDTAWTISGRGIEVNEFTAIDAGISAGDTVQVVGGVREDGAFRASRINRTDNDGSNFRFAGILASMGNDIWVISGINVEVDTNTILNGDFEVGHPVIA